MNRKKSLGGLYVLFFFICMGLDSALGDSFWNILVRHIPSFIMASVRISSKQRRCYSSEATMARPFKRHKHKVNIVTVPCPQP